MVTKRNNLNFILLALVIPSRLFCMNLAGACDDFRLAAELTNNMLSNGANPIIPVIGGALALGGAVTYLKYHLPRSTREENVNRSTRSTTFIQAVEKQASNIAMQQDAIEQFNNTKSDNTKPIRVSDVEPIFGNIQLNIESENKEVPHNTTPLSILDSTTDIGLRSQSNSDLAKKPSHKPLIADIEDYGKKMSQSCPNIALSFGISTETDINAISLEQVKSAREEIAQDLQTLSESQAILRQPISEEQIESYKEAIEKIIEVRHRRSERKKLIQRLEENKKSSSDHKSLQANPLDVAPSIGIDSDEEITDESDNENNS